MLMQLRLYRQQGQIKGDGLIIDPDRTRHSPELPWQITTGEVDEVDKGTLHFSWKMGDYNVGIGNLKRTKSGLSGSWKTTKKKRYKDVRQLGSYPHSLIRNALPLPPHSLITPNPQKP